MAQVTITINYREYAISCEDGEEGHIIKLSHLLDEKAHALTKALGPVNENLLLAMVGLIMADELNEAKQAATSASTVTSTPTTPQPPAPNIGVSKEDLQILDTELAKNLNSLTNAIKSVALSLKSI